MMMWTLTVQVGRMANVRTSKNSPLEIAEVELDKGAIGLTLCPGKKGDSLFGGRWDRDLQSDLQSVVDSGAVAVVTLMEHDELDLLAVAGLPESAENAGLEWYHLPIPDVGIPGGNFESHWLYTGHRLRAHLRAGRKVLIHCRGGLGRTGLVAARMLVEAGVPAASAIERVRAARRGAIETSVQANYVHGCDALTVDDAYLRHVLGCVLGGAVGDAFGYAIEFDRWTRITAKYGQGGLKEPVLQGGKLVVSDDTQMALFTLEGLTEGLNRGSSSKAILESVRQAYLRWNTTQQRQSLSRVADARGLLAARVVYARRAPGTTCLSACAAGAKGSPEEPTNNSKGCGGVMRTAPLGLVADFDSARTFDLAARAGAFTHGHPSGYLSAGSIAALVREVVDGANPRDAIEKVVGLTGAWPENAETVTSVEAALRAAVHQGGSNIDAIRQLGEGWVGEEALAIALYAVLVSDSFRQMVAVAANHDGDSDSTACIAGQVWGAWQGVESVPHAWVRRLDVLDPALAVLHAFVAAVNQVPSASRGAKGNGALE